MPHFGFFACEPVWVAPGTSEDGYVIGVGDAGAAAPFKDLRKGASAGGNGLVIIRYVQPDSAYD